MTCVINAASQIMINILFRATGIWCVIVFAAVFNGLFREKVLVALVGTNLALPLSGLLLSILVLLVSYILIPFLDAFEKKTFFTIGFLWVMLTLSFEFLFGYYVVEKTWHEIMEVFNFYRGNLFLLVLVVIAIAPWASAKVRGIF